MRSFFKVIIFCCGSLSYGMDKDMVPVLNNLLPVLDNLSRDEFAEDLVHSFATILHDNKITYRCMLQEISALHHEMKKITCVILTLDIERRKHEQLLNEKINKIMTHIEDLSVASGDDMVTTFSDFDFDRELDLISNMSIPK